jgi:hypothetical protein
MKSPIKVLFCASLLWATSAFGDAMPACPPGEKVVMNPVQAGAFHHNGGTCVTDPDYKPKPEPPKMTPEQEDMAKKKIILADLEAQANALEAKMYQAKATADKAKGTPDEAAAKKAADDLSVEFAAAQKAVQDAKKELEAPPTNTAKTPEAQPKAEAKASGCSISEQSSPAGFLTLLVGFVLLCNRRKQVQ